jgi:uncharacterized DUF497 family protein
MEFDWNDAKHERNIRERGLGFDFAALIFMGRVLSQVDDRWIISARKANRKERALWLA